jgi:hypothetical protein
MIRNNHKKKKKKEYIIHVWKMKNLVVIVKLDILKDMS